MSGGIHVNNYMDIYREWLTSDVFDEDTKKELRKRQTARLSELASF